MRTILATPQDSWFMKIPHFGDLLDLWSAVRVTSLCLKLLFHQQSMGLEEAMHKQYVVHCMLGLYKDNFVLF